MTKQDIRRQVRALTKAFANDPRHTAVSQAIWSKAEQLPAFSQADCVLLYCALPDEPETQSFIDKWHGKKRIVIPLVTGDTLILKEYNPEKMHPGYCNIPEPDDDALTVSPEEINLAFIPGVAFDTLGTRLGRGKGFYDRLLPRLACPTIGVCFSFQFQEDPIPADPWDIKVTQVLHD